MQPRVPVKRRNKQEIIVYLLSVRGAKTLFILSLSDLIISVVSVSRSLV